MTQFHILSGLLLFIFMLACQKSPDSQIKRQLIVPVSTELAIQKDTPEIIEAIGTVKSIKTIQIRSRVGGELQRVHFKEGDEVKKGEPMFTIDPRPYAIALQRAQADIEIDRARLNLAVLDMARYEKLIQKDYISKQLYDKANADVKSFKALIHRHYTDIENARLNRVYCAIQSPIDGKTGSLMVDEGNLVRANDEKPLAIILQMDPIYVQFSLPAQHLPDIRKYQTLNGLPLKAYPIADQKTGVVGTLTFINNTVDEATGTILLKGTFQNRERVLWPGQFVKVGVILRTIVKAVTIPNAAVQHGQQGEFVFVISKNQTAELRKIRVGPLGGPYVAVLEGLTSGEQVVTKGQFRLFPGAKVQIKNPNDQTAPQR